MAANRLAIFNIEPRSAALVGLVLLAGCRPSGSSVSGKVTLDGAPLPEATISFVPLGDATQTAGWAAVQDGQYAIAADSDLTAGKFRVEIRALKSTGAKTNANDPTLIEAQEAIPSRYNAQSELTVEIKAGENVADFSLTSKARR
jgi:hypothetical protein